MWNRRSWKSFKSRFLRFLVEALHYSGDGDNTCNADLNLAALAALEAFFDISPQDQVLLALVEGDDLLLTHPKLQTQDAANATIFGPHLPLVPQWLPNLNLFLLAAFPTFKKDLISDPKKGLLRWPFFWKPSRGDEPPSAEHGARDRLELALGERGAHHHVARAW